IGAPFPRPAIIVPPQPVVVAPPPQPVVVVPQPPPVVVAPEPALVIEPGDPVYFHAGQYYRFFNGAWFVAGAYEGPWLFVPQHRVPPRVLALPNAYGRMHPSHVQVVGPHPSPAHEDHYHGHSHWRDGRDWRNSGCARVSGEGWGELISRKALRWCRPSRAAASARCIRCEGSGRAET